MHIVFDNVKTFIIPSFSFVIAQCDSSDQAVVEVVLAVKETRGSKYYQVSINVWYT